MCLVLARYVLQNLLESVGSDAAGQQASREASRAALVFERLSTLSFMRRSMRNLWQDSFIIEQEKKNMHPIGMSTSTSVSRTATAWIVTFD
jgi:hypothetical protein